jgi:hypothetical protein
MKLPVSELTHATSDARAPRRERPRHGLSTLEYTVLVAIILIGAATMWAKLGSALSNSRMQDDAFLDDPPAATAQSDELVDATQTAKTP